MAGAVDFIVCDKVITAWFSLLIKEPVNRYKALTLQQLVMADQELWLLISQNTRGKVLAATPKPIDVPLATLKDSPEVRHHLLPLLGAKRDHEPSGKNSHRERRNLHQAVSQAVHRAKGNNNQLIETPGSSCLLESRVLCQALVWQILQTVTTWPAPKL